MTEQPRRMADEAKKVVQEGQQHAERAARQAQIVGERGMDAVLQSWGDLNKSWVSIAAEVTNYSKVALDDAARAWEQALGAKTFADLVEVQTQYAKRAYDNHMAQVSKLGKLYVCALGTASTIE